MTKITCRLPDPKVPYAYIELEFANLDEYKSEYPKVAVAILDTRKKAQEEIKKQEEPF